jgi:dTDP-4-dehydrorhamnose reductase
MAGAILVFGANGQVGWELQRSLAVLGPVVAIDRAAVDLSSPAAITALIEAQCPKAIVNAAAYTAVDKAEQERELAYAINAAAPGAMATAAAKAGIPFIHYSSDYVYAGSKQGVYVVTFP